MAVASYKFESASITMLGAGTPPGTISTLSYCSSNPAKSILLYYKQVLQKFN